MSAGRGQRLYRRAKQLMPGGTQLLSKRPEMFLPEQWPAYYRRARGAEIWDLDGRRYVDMSHNGVGACPLGYADPDVTAAVVAATESGVMTTLNCPEEVELAELLCELHPWAERVRLARTGGEAMAVAVRIARAHSGRQKVAFCGYHGWHDWYLAANLGGDALGGEGLLLPGLEPSGVPAALRGTAFAFRFNRLDEIEAIVRGAGRELAAIVCEPQRHERPRPGFLEGLRALADEAGAVLVFDEITAGFRLNPGGVHLLLGVTPDVAVFGKGIGNGHPIAAILGRAEVMDAAQSTFISSSYWTERVGPAAAVATIRKFLEVEAHHRLVRAGLAVQSIWRKILADAGLRATAGSEEMPPLAHLRFDEENPRAVQTLWCQSMLDAGYLDNAAFYASLGHSDELVEEYGRCAERVAAQVAEAVRSGRVEASLRGPVGHSGFRRLT